MSVTGRTTRSKQTTKRAATAAASGEMIVRAARVEELRRLVSSGRYKVEPFKLALKILARALRNPE
jgi:anti-sigma28 factor (negative regulator of flagellin synthesis)